MRSLDIRDFVNAGETLVSDGSGPGNNTAIFQRAIDAASAAAPTLLRGVQVFVPNGTYILAQAGVDNAVPYALRWKTRAGLIGESESGVVLKSDAGSTPIYAAYGASVLYDVTMERFTIDCSSQTNATYTTQLKGMFMQDLTRFRVKNVTFKNTWATSLGCDYLVDYNLSDITVYNCGRGIGATGSDPAAVSGGSGIGIGTGRYQYEPGVVNNLIVRGAGRLALFYERQTGDPYLSRGMVARNVTAIQCWGALQDCGCDGLDADISATDCTYGLILDKTVLIDRAGKNGRITLHAERSTTAGVLIDQAPDGAYSVRGQVRGSATGYGVLCASDAVLGPGFRFDLEADGNGASGYLIRSTTTAKSLCIDGSARNNGQSVAATYRDGITITAATDLLEITARATDDQSTATQQRGLALVGSAIGCNRARLRFDVRGSVTPVLLQHTVSNDSVVSIDGSDTTNPSNLQATSVGDGTVSLTWTAPLPDADVTDYSVQYRTSPGGSWTSFAHSASTNASITVTGLTNRTAYDFRVAKVTASGTGSYTAGPTTATPLAPILYSASFAGTDAASLGSTDGGTGSATPWTVTASTTWKRTGGFGQPASGSTSVARITCAANGEVGARISSMNSVAWAWCSRW